MTDPPASAPGSRALLLLLAVAVGAISASVSAAGIPAVLVALLSLVLTYWLGRVAPDEQLWTLVGALQLVRAIAFVAGPSGPLWLPVVGWPFGIAVDAALVAVGQAHGFRAQGRAVSMAVRRRIARLVGLAAVMCITVLIGMVVAFQAVDNRSVKAQVDLSAALAQAHGDTDDAWVRSALDGLDRRSGLDVWHASADRGQLLVIVQVRFLGVSQCIAGSAGGDGRPRLTVHSHACGDLRWPPSIDPTE
jgi:hypothetical protein